MTKIVYDISIVAAARLREMSKKSKLKQGQILNMLINSEYENNKGEYLSNGTHRHVYV